MVWLVLLIAALLAVIALTWTNRVRHDLPVGPK